MGGRFWHPKPDTERSTDGFRSPGMALDGHEPCRVVVCHDRGSIEKPCMVSQAPSSAFPSCLFYPLDEAEEPKGGQYLVASYRTLCPLRFEIKSALVDRGKIVYLKRRPINQHPPQSESFALHLRCNTAGYHKTSGSGQERIDPRGHRVCLSSTSSIHVHHETPRVDRYVFISVFTYVRNTAGVLTVRWCTTCLRACHSS